MVNTQQPFVSLRQAMDQLLNESVVGAPFRTLWSQGATALGAMPLDVYATADEVVVLAAVPGLRPEDLDVSVQQGTLLLSGRIADAAESAEATGATWFLRELPHGTFRRAVGLPFAVDADQAQASFEHGVLRIVLPKAEAAKPRTIPLTVGGATQAIAAGGDGQQS